MIMKKELKEANTKIKEQEEEIQKLRTKLLKTKQESDHLKTKTENEIKVNDYHYYYNSENKQVTFHLFKNNYFSQKIKL